MSLNAFPSWVLFCSYELSCCMVSHHFLVDFCFLKLSVSASVSFSFNWLIISIFIHLLRIFLPFVHHEICHLPFFLRHLSFFHSYLYCLIHFDYFYFYLILCVYIREQGYSQLVPYTIQLNYSFMGEHNTPLTAVPYTHTHIQSHKHNNKELLIDSNDETHTLSNLEIEELK